MPDLYQAPPEKKEKKREEEEKVIIKKKAKKIKKIKRLDPYARIVKERLSSNFSLAVFPRHVHFSGRKNGEKVLILLRRHWITNLPWLLSFLVMVLVSVPLFRFSATITDSSALPWLFFYAWLLFSLAVFWAGFLSWYFNVNIISNRRIVDIDFYDLIYREVTDAEIEKIQDVTHNMGGVLGVFFNYGDVYIQTAGTKPRIEFLKIPRPAQVAETIQRLIEEEEKEKRREK